MANAKLSELSLFTDAEIQSLQQNGISTAHQILSVPSWKLRYILNTATNDDAEDYLRKVVFKTNIIPQTLITNPRTAWKMYEEYSNIKLHLPLRDIPTFNQLFKGGVSLNSITEIVGQSMSGKTEFCLTAICDMIMEADDYGCVLFDTEKKQISIVQRLFQILRSRESQLSDEEIERKICDRCTIIDVSNSKELIESLDNLEEYIFEKNIKLLVIDSLGTLASKEFMGKEGGIFERASVLQTEATLLKQLSEKFKVGILVTNTSSSENEQAHLGVNWYHFVNHRLKIYKVDRSKVILSIQKSPLVSNANISLTIEDTGVKEIVVTE